MSGAPYIYLVYDEDGQVVNVLTSAEAASLAKGRGAIVEVWQGGRKLDAVTTRYLLRRGAAR